MGPEILVMGALHLDVVVDAPHLPATDETVVGRGVAYRLGGKGANQAVAAARMGARVAMAGRVGRDAFGARLLAGLDAAEVDRRQVAEVDGPSGMSVAIVAEGGDYGAVIVSGANAGLDGAAVQVPAGVRVLMLQNEVPEAANLAVAGQAGAARVILNAAPARPVARELLARTHVLIVNRGEAAALAGSAAPAEAALRLRAAGPETVIVTLGGDGLVAATPQGPFALPAPRVRAVSSHGAGDAFAGALAAELVRGAPLPAALAFAQAAAALTVATPPDDRATIDASRVRAFLAGSEV